MHAPSLPSKLIRHVVLPAAALGTLALSACSGATASTGAAPPAAPATQPTQAASGGTTSQTTKVNVNTASVAELQQAFQAAGIPNAARWAQEVNEYRPYPTDDPSFAKLRGELAKYNPSPDVVDKIISTLTLA
jgi:hypothetical protein